jgi:hypothetical protein
LTIIELQTQRNRIFDHWVAVGRDDGLEQGFELERRVAERISAARAEAEEATAAEAALSAQVDELRGQIAMGVADPKSLHGVKMRLARAQERTANASSGLRAVERWAARERDAHLEATRARSRDAYLEAMAAKRELARRAAASIRDFLSEVDRLQADVATLNSRYRNPRIERVMEDPIGQLREELARRAELMEGAARS